MSRKERGEIWLGASGLVVNSSGQWLVVRKNYGVLKGLWSIPVGFVECNETGNDCRVEGMLGFRTGD